MMKVGEIFFPDDNDFQRFKTECTTDQDWTVCYNKPDCRVATKKNQLSPFDVMRIQSDLNGISADLIYDVIHDGKYRSTWDTAMLSGYEICTVTPNSDIGYYLVKCPPPFKNRDFVTQRCWIDFGPTAEKCILNHSVNYLKEPPKKNVVRGISFHTGYLIIPTGPSSCRFYYMTQSDPGGSLPAWLMNNLSRVFAPNLMKKLTKACAKYAKWKSQNDPAWKPWLNPDQMMTLPRYDPNDIGRFDINETLTSNSSPSEASIAENTVEIENFDKRRIRIRRDQLLAHLKLSFLPPKVISPPDFSSSRSH